MKAIGKRSGVALLAAWMLTSFAAPVFAGTTGRIAGRVLDNRKQPVVGANLTIPAARLGAVTDENGRYSILNIPAGLYEVKANLLGYRGVATQNVEVIADNTTTLDLTLIEAPVEIAEIVVSAKRPVVDVNLTSSLASINREEIAKLPVQELQEVVNLQAGVVDGHFRGGRIGEVQYQVDGVSVNNAYDNKTTLRLDRSLLQEVQVISGTFDAEYGQAMSGVVNAVLRRGDETFEWDGEAMIGGYNWSNSGSRIQEPKFEPADIQNLQLSVSGPVKLPKTTYLLNGRYGRRNEWVHGIRAFSPARDTGSISQGTSKAFTPDGDFEEIPLAWSREWSGVMKVANRSIPGVEVSYQALANWIKGQKTDGMWAWRYNPDGRGTQRTTSIAHGIDWTHTLNPSSYYSLALRQNYFDYTDYAFEDAYDSRYDAYFAPVDVSTPTESFFYAGVDLTRFAQRTDTWVVKSTFVSELQKLHHFKTGLEAQWPKVFFGTPVYVVQRTAPDGTQYLQRHVEDLPALAAPQTYHPVTLAGYAQDEIEWEGLRLRAGVRLDYFDARTTVPSDLANPANNITGAPASPPVATTAKIAWSPRLGVSYPVTDKTSLFFAYGHFVQMPALGQVFDNANYGTLTDLQASTSYSTVGNPDIKPEKSVQYQFGFKQAITDNLGLDVNAFYKDIRDLLGVEFISTYNDAEYPRFTNVDFGSVVGFTLALDQRELGPLSLGADYTWQSARGNSSDARETATRAQGGLDPRPRQVPFNWDQRHTFNLTATLARESRYSFSGVFRVGSGQPYTPTTQLGGAGTVYETNSGRKPMFTLLDLRAEAPVELGGRPVTLFGRAFNVLDSRFSNGFVFANSGSPYYTFPLTSSAIGQLNDPTRFYGPRRLEFGITMRGGKR